MEEARSSWREALTAADRNGQALRRLAKGSAYDQLVQNLKALNSPPMLFSKESQALFEAGTAVGAAYKAWQYSEQMQMERMRKILGPMADIRNSMLGSSATQELINQLSIGRSVSKHINEAVEQALGLGSVAKLQGQQSMDLQGASKKFLEDLNVDGRIHTYLNDFAQANKHWKVPNELMGVVGSFKALQDQLGKVALPTIDWGSAAALAQALGPEGIQEQLDLLGIEPDGSMRESKELPERGLLSRKQADALALLSLLLTILVFIYQEISSQQDKAKTEAFQIQTTDSLRAQAQQIQSLTFLIEKALAQAAQVPEERMVVRERFAIVRSEPEHGATVEGKLMPNEVVRSIGRDGKWVEVEYYHWLREEYRNGWVLKKYLERVPANHVRAVNNIKP